MNWLLNDRFIRVSLKNYIQKYVDLFSGPWRLEMKSKMPFFDVVAAISDIFLDT